MSDNRLQTPDKKDVKTFRDLIAYQKSKALVKIVYDTCNAFPRNDFALQNQLQRAAISVPTNLAEGQERFSDKESVWFLYIARASLAEVEVLLDIAKDLEYITVDQLNDKLVLINEIARLINGLINYLKNKN